MGIVLMKRRTMPSDTAGSGVDMREQAAVDVEYIDQRRERLETIAILALSAAGI